MNTAKDMLIDLGPLDIVKNPGSLLPVYVIAKEEYYNGQPTLSDEEFDEMESVLISNGLGFVTKVVGAPVPSTTPFHKREHPRKMLSLNKVKGTDKLAEWVGDVAPVGEHTHTITPKFDGLAIRLEYSSGILIKAVTRGDGSEGEDIIENVKLIPSIPKEVGRLGFTNSFSIRGEIYLLDQIFLSIFAPRGYKTARNAAAGVARTQDENRRYCEYLSFTPYDTDEIPGIHSHSARMTVTRAFGFIPPYLVQTDSRRVKHHIESIMKIIPDLGYDIDGLVVRVDNDEDYHRIGSTSHHPKGSMAFKFEDKGDFTRLIDVVWQTGPTGEITPVAIVEPVIIGGVTIERVNLHNYTFIQKYGLELGCEVEVIRANDVIPQITRRI